MREGIRFSIFLTENNDILVKPKDEVLELSDEEWSKLVSLACNKKNISKKFKKTNEAIKYLKRVL